MILEQEKIALLSEFKNIQEFKHLQFYLLENVVTSKNFNMSYTISYENEFKMLIGLVDIRFYDDLKPEICFRYHPLLDKLDRLYVSAINHTISHDINPEVKFYVDHYKNKLMSHHICCIQCGTTFYAVLSEFENVYTCKPCREHKGQLVEKLDSYTSLGADIVLLVLSLL